MGLPLPKAGSGLYRVIFDFDSTLAEPTWPSPELGAPIQRGVDALMGYVALGYEIAIWTARPASHVEAIWQWVTDQGLDRVVYDVIPNKPAAIAFVDDRAITFPEAFLND